MLKHSIVKQPLADVTNAPDITTNKRKRQEGDCITDEGIGDEANATFWKERYFQLRKLKSEMDKEMAKLIEKSEEREKELLTQLSHHGPPCTLQTQPSVHPTSQSLEEFIKQKRVVSFFELLTGISLVEQCKNKYICTVKNTTGRKFARFSLTQSIESGNIEYEPLVNVEELPEYMQCSLEFDESVAPVMVGDVLAKLFDTST
mmetsp:Transcript_3910/g.6125  ORF Transcript_3910/g.6125 Transcript_3910/m.6125 type:complete len:203 (+) Transcript_3910:58-666(+)